MTIPEEGRSADIARRRLAAALRVATPFPWQLSLLDRFLSGDSPSAIDVPTGLGKTAVIAIWLVARAAGATVPRRLIYVVDRRAVVDQATQIAEDLRNGVEGDEGFKKDLQLEGALPISTLRGKHVDNRQWLADPTAPAIVIGTVDMIGSRLLFRGYGVSDKMRPYHAGLLGADALIVLDEAHLTPPFERLIDAIASGRDARGRSLRPSDALGDVVPTVRFLSLSATGRARGNALTLSAADRDHSVVTRRLRAPKAVRVLEDVPEGDLPEALANQAWSLSNEGKEAIRCLVFCDRRDDATKVLDGLMSRARKVGMEPASDLVELFVGGRRVYERENEAARWLADKGFLAGSSKRPNRPAFVIATSAGEVGVDLDADHMVSDLVAWERMVQRLGRVNRRGERDASVVIVPAISDRADTTKRLAAVRGLLAKLPRRPDGAIDASPGALTALRERSVHEPRLGDLIGQGSTPADLHPPLERPTVEAWSMTSLEEHSGRPEVAPWIRGWIEDEEAQTSVVWRKYLPITDRGHLFSAADLETFRDIADPHLAERLETETYRVVDWLGRRARTLEGPSENEATLAPSDRPLLRTDVFAVILDGPSGPRAITADDLSKDKRQELHRALAGGLLMVDARLGGLKRGLLREDASEAVVDVTAVDDDLRVVPFRVRRVADLSEKRPAGWRTEGQIAVSKSADEEQVWLVLESLIADAAESEEGRSVVRPGRAQKLDEHESWAEEAAHRIAKRLALPQAYAQMLKVAARLHDEGKRARCWQLAFNAPRGDAYAKTTSRPNLGILAHYRHELGSLPYAERDERVRGLDEPLRELCLHLIASHHGYARPLIRIDGAEEPPSRLSHRAEAIALRFAALERRWGPWGLAWWEALLRAADQQASRRNDEAGADRG
jgi:CRISPR-associated endonuclease/helicase Cas3